MQWDYGTYSTDIGPGLQRYVQLQGYAGFAYDYENVYGSRSSSWQAYTAALAAGPPVIVDLVWGAGGHSTVGRGYWNDGEILCQLSAVSQKSQGSALVNRLCSMAMGSAHPTSLKRETASRAPTNAPNPAGRFRA
jgi:hypothetical protein